MKHISALFLVAMALNASMLFAAAPAAKEFIDGKKAKFSTKGHAKAKGLDMAVSYPNSWTANEGERPNIVQKFVSDGGRGLEMAMIVTKALAVPAGTRISEAELNEFFTASNLKAMVPDGAKFIDAKPTKIEDLPAGILEYSARQERAGLTVDIQTIAYVFVHGTTMVQFQCQVGRSTSSPAELNQRMADFKPLFTLMANSIVLNSRWK